MSIPDRPAQLPRVTETDPIFSHGSQGSINERLPLFGDSTSQRDRLISIGLSVTCVLLIIVLTVTLFFKLSLINIVALVIVFSITASHAVLIYWYRLGDLDPKFRLLLIWNSVNLVILCITMLLYYHHS
ncbi:transmembrane protein 243-like [Panonychus citri]|uniref:transmembrane protein 243-like n=1 Tax=Panonychus citri TaxID=50023 RepID=UPI00230812B7|nr:transmembrane protein 243-like [Panonychus citri]